jgi:hypothetical protein
VALSPQFLSTTARFVKITMNVMLQPSIPKTLD